MTTQPPDASQLQLMKRELINFLELSIGEKTDNYLRQLALLSEHGGKDKTENSEQQNQTTLISTTTELKNTQSTSEAARKPITGVITAPKSILFPMQWRVGVKFMLQLHAISGPQCRQTKLMTRLHIPKLSPDTVLFWNWWMETNGAFILSFSDINNAFNSGPSLLYPEQNFSAEVLSLESSTIKLCLIEKITTA